MSVLHTAADQLLHLDRHLSWLLMSYGRWLYLILFGLFFAETGLVVTPFLPGDSLLFGVGALAAVDRSGTLQVLWLFPLLVTAAVLGNSVNYLLGRRLGQWSVTSRYRPFKLEHLQRTEQYFRHYGGPTVLLARFVPIVRTFAPFVAGMGRMAVGKFQMFNILGATAWIALFLFGGYGFGNLPWVRNNFGLVTLTVLGLSLLPLLVFARHEAAPK